MIQDGLSPVLRTYWRERHTIPGLLDDIDFLIFDHLLRTQAQGSLGDLLEIGSFMGKSAIVIGAHVRDHEKFTVCDTFEESTGDIANDAENLDSYQGLTRHKFLANYERFARRDPEIVQELSSTIRAHVADESVRFAHVDGGHLFDVVHDDIANIRHLLAPGGLIAFDDFRAVHTPGVAAALWEAVANDRMIPICVTETKMYATWDETAASDTFDQLGSWLAGHGEVRTGTQFVHGRRLLLVANPKIWTRRRRIRALLPPGVVDRIAPPPEPHLGG